MKRPKHPIPNFVNQTLEEHGLIAEYNARPAHQRNDYIGWINNAKLQKTKEKRVNQMVAELEKGGVYMKMSHPPSTKSKKKEGRNESKIPNPKWPT